MYTEPVYTVSVYLQCRWDCIHVKMEHKRVSITLHLQRLFLC